MMPKTILDCIGRTPMLLLELEHEGTLYKIPCKAEFMNPTGSVKDRIACYMVEQAEKRGELRAGSVIVEVSSGNTGIALAQVAAVKGYRLIILMPEHMSRERVRLLQSLGAEVCLTPQEEGFSGALTRLRNIVESSPRAYCPRQFENPDNVGAHYAHTGPEIWEQMAGGVDAFVDGVGTGGTLMGVGRFLRERNPKLCLVAVEPDEAAIMCSGIKMISRVRHQDHEVRPFFDPIIRVSWLGGERICVAHADGVSLAGQHVRQAELLDLNRLIFL